MKLHIGKNLQNTEQYARVILGRNRQLSYRQIETEYGIPKSVAGRIGKHIDKYNKLPKVLYIDIENAPSIAAAFNRFNVNISHEHVMEEGGWLLSVAWQWNSEQKPSSVVLDEAEALLCDDSKIVRYVHDLMQEADVVIAHNAKKFDITMLNARFVLHGLSPVHASKIVDTLVIAKRFKFNSRKLDSLCDYLGVGRKLEHSGIRLWLDCMHGDEKALNTMAKYNRQDIVLLRELHKVIAPWDLQGFNAGHFNETDAPVCPTCGSSHVEKTGKLVYRGVSSYEEFQCKDCGTISRGRQNMTPKSVRKNMLIPV